MLHGREAARQACETARKTFEEGALANTLPTIEVPGAAMDDGMGLLGLLVAAGLAGSNGEARRHVKAGAVKVNDEAVSDDRLTLDRDALVGGVVKLSVGRKKHVLVKPAA